MTCARPFGALPSKMFEVLAVALMATLAGVAFGFLGQVVGVMASV